MTPSFDEASRRLLQEFSAQVTDGGQLYLPRTLGTVDLTVCLWGDGATQGTLTVRLQEGKKTPRRYSYIGTMFTNLLTSAEHPTKTIVFKRIPDTDTFIYHLPKEPS